MYIFFFLSHDPSSGKARLRKRPAPRAANSEIKIYSNCNDCDPAELNTLRLEAYHSFKRSSGDQLASQWLMYHIAYMVVGFKVLHFHKFSSKNGTVGIVNNFELALLATSKSGVTSTTLTYINTAVKTITKSNGAHWSKTIGWKTLHGANGHNVLKRVSASMLPRTWAGMIIISSEELILPIADSATRTGSSGYLVMNGNFVIKNWMQYGE
jgi:hypothetical protein